MNDDCANAFKEINDNTPTLSGTIPFTHTGRSTVKGPI